MRSLTVATLLYLINIHDVGMKCMIVSFRGVSTDK